MDSRLKDVFFDFTDLHDVVLHVVDNEETNVLLLNLVQLGLVPLKTENLGFGVILLDPAENFEDFGFVRSEFAEDEEVQENGGNNNHQSDHAVHRRIRVYFI